ncbi:hypothetical protein [Quisquiliibacterium transsilvanicum]|uniref:Uncharacterized protein n=1 Tax=Quisquiliibacterium transsilvanicum TaxID=1549638 RepID=A0A7W8HGF0_9BURK|nr:hypothetical protein [Quisquiliibacterium transsilvanicum]MBB5271520.1 hypothetical protein [Quisquiliibacterium transsilvanicum]
MSCAGHCKHAKCPTPYTCGLYELDNPQPIQFTGREPDERLPAVGWFFVGLAVGCALSFAILSLYTQ